MQPKLTPTTNDGLQGNGTIPHKRGPGRPPKIKIVAPHEPVQEAGEMWQIRPLIVEMPITPNAAQGIAASNFAELSPAPVVEPNPLKVAIIGTAPSSRMLAPFNDLSWKIWACSPGNMNALPRVDVWFEVHANFLWPENEHYGRPYIEWLKQQKFPVYMQDQKLIPHALTIPMRELVQEFGPYFFTSSFSWMMAMAMKMGAKEVSLFGVDMASRDEYILQRPGAYHFFTEAAKRGVKISAPYESDIMQPPALYGYSEVTQIGRKLLARKKEITDRTAALRQQRDSAAQQLTYLEGALEDNDYMLSIFGGAQSHPFPDANGQG